MIFIVPLWSYWLRTYYALAKQTHTIIVAAISYGINSRRQFICYIPI